MLDATELAARLRRAMDTHKPRISSVALAEACNVTAQAVNGWRKTGRIHKKHLATIAKLTGHAIDWFVGDLAPAHDVEGELQAQEAAAFANLRKSSREWRNYVLSLAQFDPAKQRLWLDMMREASPEAAIAPIPQAAPRKVRQT